MPEIEPIIAIAREVLVGRSPLAREDTFLFDHSLRVMHVADRLARCEEASSWRIDRFSLSVAALFHQAATVRLDEEPLCGVPRLGSGVRFPPVSAALGKSCSLQPPSMV